MSKVHNWVGQNKDQLGVYLSGLQVIGIAAAVATVWLTASQIELARKTAQATTQYQIQKDGREFLAAMSPISREYIFGSTSGRTYDASTLAMAQQQIALLLNYFASAWHQHEKGTLDRQAWASMRQELCGYLDRKHVSDVWAFAVQQHVYSDDFVREIDRCRTPSTSESSLNGSGAKPEP